MRRCCYILFLLVLLSACSDNREVVALLDHAEAVMEEHPDSAYQFLCEADSCVADQSRKTRMRHLMLKTEAENKLYLQLPSDTTFQEVVDYYDHHGTPNQQLKAHYLLGSIYLDRGEAPMALQCFNDAMEKADTLSNDCDYTTLFSVYGQMADVFEAQVMPNEEIEALQQYSKYAQKAGNTYEHIRGVEFMAGAYDILGDTSMILAMEQKATELYRKHNMPQAAASALTMSIRININRGNFKEAKHMIETFETESGLFDVEGNICEGREHYYHTKGLYYLGIGQLDSAEYEFKRLIPYGYTFDAYKGLMMVYKKRKNYTTAASFMDLREASFDTLVTNIHAEATRQVKGMYDYARHQRIAMEKVAESERNRNIIYLLVFVITIVAFCLYHLQKRAKAKKKREIKRLSQQYMDVLTRYEETKNEMSVMETDFAFFQQQKQEELSNLQSRLSDLQHRYGNLEQTERIEALKQSPVWEAFMDRLDPKKKTKPITDREWDKLSVLFSQCVPSLYARMTHNNLLSQHEQRVTILTRLGMHTGETAILLDLPLQRITNARASSNNKLFADHSARTFLKNISQI